MSRVLKTAMAFWLIGLLASVSCLVHTSPVSMMVFSFLGVPAFGVAAILYLSELLLVLRRRQVL
jgi:hypothetical protein